MDSIPSLVMLIPGAPLVATLVVAVLGPRVLRGLSHLPVVVALLVSFIGSVFLVEQVRFEQADTAVGKSTVDSARENRSAGDPAEFRIGFELPVRLWTWVAIENASTQPDPPGESQLSVVDRRRDFRVDVTLRADALTATMLCMVTFVALLVAIFASAYMHGDPGYWRFFAYFGLFVFSMTMLVSVSNFLLLFVFWEAVGLCSYLLIGFWYHKPEAAAAGKKAFLVNRVGDFGFTLAMLLIWTTYGTLNFHDSLSDGTADPDVVLASYESQLRDASPAEGGSGAGSAGVETPSLVRGVLGRSRIVANDYLVESPRLGWSGRWTVFFICVLLMLGACGKSAQFPLHVWLPDAMEGPTPVSALIHAATMVTAGVYMVARCTPLFMASPAAQLVVASIGGFTALLAGLIALTQFDLKRVLAYSTVSQLGLMFVGLGLGTFSGITAGMFHLLTHAFFKALLFLGAGSVMHAMGNVIDMRRFGGLRHVMPHTHRTFFIGCLALAGIVPLSGFWSKDAILGALHDKVHALKHELESRDTEPEGGEGTWTEANGTAGARPLARASVAELSRSVRVYGWIGWAALLTTFLTAFYTFRACFMTFYGDKVVPHEAGGHAHESPQMMVLPLWALAVGAIFIGMFLGGPAAGFQPLASFLGTTPSLAGGWVSDTRAPFEFHVSVAATSLLLSLAGCGLAAYMYLGEAREIEVLKWLLDFRWLAGLTDGETVTRMRGWGWVRAIQSGAERVSLGGLATFAGNLSLLVLAVLSAPLLIGSFISPYKLSYQRFLWDEIYDAAVVRPLRGLASVLALLDRVIVDGAVNACGQMPLVFGSLMRSLQTGLVQFYALVMLLGVLVLLLARLLVAA